MSYLVKQLEHYMRDLAIIILGLALLGVGCVYRPPIKQGNFLGKSKVSQLKSGMTEGQVEYLLGTPMLDDPFHHSRWDYVYFLQPSDWGKADKERRLIIYFKNGKVARIRTPNQKELASRLHRHGGDVALSD